MPNVIGIIHSSLMDFIVLYVLLAISDATAIEVLIMLLGLVIIFPAVGGKEWSWLFREMLK